MAGGKLPFNSRARGGEVSVGAQGVTSAVTQAGGTSQDLWEARNVLRVLFPSTGGENPIQLLRKL